MVKELLRTRLSKIMTTILCIDDDPRVLEGQKALLEGKGYKVLIAFDGATGIEMSRKNSVDAIVLDFNMAGMDGNQVAATLMKEQPNLPVVIRSGSFVDIPESLKWYADALLEKGDRPENLLLVIEELIALSGTPKKHSRSGTVRTSQQRTA